MSTMFGDGAQANPKSFRRLYIIERLPQTGNCSAGVSLYAGIMYVVAICFPAGIYWYHSVDIKPVIGMCQIVVVYVS